MFRRIDFAAALRMQKLKRLFEALRDHLGIVSSARSKPCVSCYGDRQSSENLCVAAKS